MFRPPVPLVDAYTKSRQFLANVGFIYRLLFACAPIDALIIIILTVFRGLQAAVQIYTTKLIIDSVIPSTQGSHHGVTLMVSVAVLCLLVVVNRITHPIEALCQGRAGLALSNALSKSIMSKAAAVPYDQYDNASYYDMIDKAKRETGSNPIDMLLYTMWFVQALINCASMLATVAVFTPLAAGAVIITALPAIIFQYSVSHRSWRVMNSTTPEVRRLNYLRDLLTQRPAAKEVRLFGLSEWILEKYDNIFCQYASQFLGALASSTRTNILTSLLAGLGLA